MGFLDRFFARSPRGRAAALLGRWRLAEADGDLEVGDGVRMEFRRDGRLLYTILGDGRERITRLMYRVEGDTLITDQPLSNRQQKTKFTLLGPDTLVLDYGGSRAWFERMKH